MVCGRVGQHTSWHHWHPRRHHLSDHALVILEIADSAQGSRSTYIRTTQCLIEDLELVSRVEAIWHSKDYSGAPSRQPPSLSAEDQCPIPRGGHSSCRSVERAGAQFEERSCLTVQRLQETRARSCRRGMSFERQRRGDMSTATTGRRPIGLRWVRESRRPTSLS